MSNNETEESAMRLEAIYDQIEKEASEAALMWPWGYSQRDYEDGKPRPAMVVNADRKEYYKKGATPYGEKLHDAQEQLEKMAKALDALKEGAEGHTIQFIDKALTDYNNYLKQGKDDK